MTLLSKILQIDASPEVFLYTALVSIFIFGVAVLIILYKLKFSLERFLDEVGIPKIIALAIIAIVLALLFQAVSGYVEESIHEAISEKANKTLQAPPGDELMHEMGKLFILNPHFYFEDL